MPSSAIQKVAEDLSQKENETRDQWLERISLGRTDSGICSEKLQALMREKLERENNQLALERVETFGDE
jgi:hypothetical protein